MIDEEEVGEILREFFPDGFTSVTLEEALAIAASLEEQLAKVVQSD